MLFILLFTTGITFMLVFVRACLQLHLACVKYRASGFRQDEVNAENSLALTSQTINAGFSLSCVDMGRFSLAWLIFLLLCVHCNLAKSVAWLFLVG